ncbi:MAG TPA: repressor LexA [Dehalococcoidia bacterium]|nr:repressor LexA [Dehalococcoidia bacterium]HIL30430.1 repressor LexA [Dehalococcoidia bacterium]
MVSRKKMPPRRQRILGFLQEFYLENGIPPTVRDIQKACDISSTSVVDYNLDKLEQAGYINRRPDVARGIKILDQDGQPVSNAPRVQIVGAIAAGIPIPAWSTEASESSQEFDTVEVAPELQRQHGTLFALRVKGTSMIDALIDDGDVVIIKPSNTVNNGETVVAWLKEEEETTLKKFYAEGSQVRLQPANSTMDPIYCAADNVEVRGKVVSVIRQLGKNL